MARLLRIEYPGATYHVMARGNQGRAIYRDDRDRLRFLETLAPEANEVDVGFPVSRHGSP